MWAWRAGTAIAAAFIVSASVGAWAAGDPENGAKVFKKCMACHRIGPGARALVGPELNAVVGRKAGSIPDFPYSSAMKASGLTWNEATLTTYLKSPRALVPGTRMTFAGISKDQDIFDLIAYLKTFDADGNPAKP
jgi:cytochrome c